MGSRPFDATEFGRLFGDAWAGWTPKSEVMAIQRGDRGADSLRELFSSQVITAIHQFDDDPNQAEADFWEGFVAGVNELLEGADDTQDLLRRLEKEEEEE